MKRIHLPLPLIIISFFLLFSITTFAQYLETFPTAEKGILIGGTTTTSGCTTNDPTSCTSFDFSGVDWMINGDLSLVDINDYVKTISGAFEFGGDIDEEVCFESPLLDISAVSATYSVFIDWNGQDNADYIDVEYQINGGSWIQIPNQFGGGSHTIDYTTSGNDGSATITQPGIIGSTLSVRVCADTNTSVELTRIDNVSVPQATVVALPIELISFNAEKREKEVMLKWATSTEFNSEKFEIEHSSNGERFETIGEIKSKGDVNLISNYSFNHVRPASGQNYYRLKQIDFDGQYEYSQIATVNITSKENHLGDFYPNPSNDGIVNLDYWSVINAPMNVSVYDANGRNVFVQNFEVVKGENNFNFDLKDLTNGIYFIEIRNESISFHRKLIIN